MRVGIIGGGVVGSATAAAWRGHCDEVRVYDRDPARKTHKRRETLQSDVVFVCLPEVAVDGFFQDTLPGPFGAKGRMEDYVDVNYVLKSTVPVGTTRRLAEQYGLTSLVHSPEFLTARTAEYDAANPRLNVIGYPQYPSATVTNYGAVKLMHAYTDRWPDVPWTCMNSDASELMKLAMNSFFAAKVSYWNEVESYCRAVGVDYETVRAACVAEGRIGDLHTHVPGPDGRRGFGGACLPKDLAQLAKCMNEAGVRAPVLEAVNRRNKELDRPG